MTGVDPNGFMNELVAELRTMKAKKDTCAACQEIIPYATGGYLDNDVQVCGDCFEKEKLR